MPSVVFVFAEVLMAEMLKAKHCSSGGKFSLQQQQQFGLSYNKNGTVDTVLKVKQAFQN